VDLRIFGVVPIQPSKGNGPQRDATGWISRAARENIPDRFRGSSAGTDDAAFLDGGHHVEQGVGIAQRVTVDNDKVAVLANFQGAEGFAVQGGDRRVRRHDAYNFTR